MLVAIWVVLFLMLLKHMVILCFYLNSYLTWNKTVSSLTYRNTKHLGYVLEDGSLPGQEVSSLDQVRPRTTAELLPDQGRNGVHNNQPYSVGDDFFLQALQPFKWKESNLNEIKLINVNILHVIPLIKLHWKYPGSKYYCWKMIHEFSFL